MGVLQTLISPEELRQLETDLATLISRDGPTIQALLHKRATEEPQGWLSQWFVAITTFCVMLTACAKRFRPPPHRTPSLHSSVNVRYVVQLEFYQQQQQQHSTAVVGAAL